MTTIMGVTFGKIKNVRKDVLEEGVYFAEVEISFQEGFPFEWNNYCARADDHALTGKWVYQQIMDGNFEGGITLTEPFEPEDIEQPISQGAQTL
jgi:hypothetical protein